LPNLTVADVTTPSGFSFLHAVWQAQGYQKGYVFISFKKRNGDWVDVPCPIIPGKWETFMNDPDRDEWGIDVPAVFPRKADMYFCPNVFEKPQRKKEFALPTVWLHADLDEVDPDTLDLLPTVAWQTSKGRYQCLWLVDCRMKVKHFEALNQRLTYLTAADKGGWSVTKVLRIPETMNYKRGEPEPVQLLWWEHAQTYPIKAVLDLVRDVKVVRQATVEDLNLPDMTADAVYHKYRKVLSNRARQLVRTRTARGDRSARLWELETSCLASGLSQGETLILVRGTVWNKYAGQRRELDQLSSEIAKAAGNIVRDRPASVKKRRRNKNASSNGRVHDEEELPLISYRDFLGTPIPHEKWDVDGIWSHLAHGILAGEPKTYKSIISTDLALSVASGTKFLGEYEVPKVGPVIIIQEENDAPLMRDRIEKIATSKGLITQRDEDVVNGPGLIVSFPGTRAEVPLWLMNGQNFSLFDEDHVERLRRSLDRIKPKLLIFDPLYLVAPGLDENSQAQVAPLLSGLLKIKRAHDCGILIVHHYNKPREGEDRHPGMRLSGSSTFYRWFSSAVYLEKGHEPGMVKMSTEHRGAGSKPVVKLEIEIEDEYDVHVEHTVGDSNTALKRQLLTILRATGKAIALPELVDEMGVSRDRVIRLAERSGCRVAQSPKPTGKAGRRPLLVYLPGD
jgi:AAA domain/RepB DNA-primase from phage plasmid